MMTFEDRIWEFTDELYEELRDILNECNDLDKKIESEDESDEDWEELRAELWENRSTICYKIAIAEECLKMWTDQKTL